MVRPHHTLWRRSYYSLYSLSDPTVTYVRLSSIVYTVREGDSVNACLVVDYNEGSRDCPFGYQFEVSVITVDGTAGKLADQLTAVWIDFILISSSVQCIILTISL